DKRSYEIKNKTASTLLALKSRTPYEATLGDNPANSSLIPFAFHGPVWYYHEVAGYMRYWELSEVAVPIV
ncbi:MAG: hypothetical protein ACK53Y_02160, partial [bacterium]